MPTVLLLDRSLSMSRPSSIDDLEGGNNQIIRSTVWSIYDGTLLTTEFILLVRRSNEVVSVFKRVEEVLRSCNQQFTARISIPPGVFLEMRCCCPFHKEP